MLECDLEAIFPPLGTMPQNTAARISSVVLGVSAIVAAVAIAVFSSLPLLSPLILGGIGGMLLIGGLTGSDSLMKTAAVIALAVLVAFPMSTVCPGFV